MQESDSNVQRSLRTQHPARHFSVPLQALSTIIIALSLHNSQTILLYVWTERSSVQHKAWVDHGTAQEVMQSLTNLALTCQEMSQLVVDIALPALEERVEREAWERFQVASDEDGKLPPYWDQILRNPTSCKLPELKVQ